MPPRRALLALALVAMFAASCSSGGDEPRPTGASGTGSDGGTVNAAMASTDLYVGTPQRVEVGLVLNDGRLISYGSVDMSFTFTGDGSGSTGSAAGPSATAVYLPTPGTSDGTTPTITQPSEARGVYEATNVTFDRPGYWKVDVLADVGGEAMRASTTFGVAAEPALPAPGQAALETENLTIADHDDAPLSAVDSRAIAGGTIPDEILHRSTIADAISSNTPAVVVFSTPTFCTSKFCGPITDVVQDLAERYSDRADFIHVEIYKEYQQGNVVINQAAADWLYRNGDLTEPWLYLIGSDGTIQDRWSVLFRKQELEAALKALPPMKG
jgi:hypothetical protein